MGKLSLNLYVVGTDPMEIKELMTQQNEEEGLESRLRDIDGWSGLQCREHCLWLEAGLLHPS